MSNNSQRQRRYWTKFFEYLNQQGSQLQFPNAREPHYIEFGMGNRCVVMVRHVIKPRPGALSVMFCIRGPNALTFFDALRRQQAEIENEFGESIQWWGEVHQNEQRLGLIKDDIDPTDERDWPNQHEWLATRLEKFNAVVRPRIERLYPEHRRG